MRKLILALLVALPFLAQSANEKPREAGGFCAAKDSSDDGKLEACGTLSDSMKAGTSLTATDLRGFKGVGVNFNEADFSASTLDHMNLRNCSGEKSVWKGARGEGFIVIGGRYSHAQFSESHLPNCEFRFVYMPFADFSGADLKGCRFVWSYLIGANWKNANLEGSTFDKCVGAPSLSQP